MSGPGGPPRHRPLAGELILASHNAGKLAELRALLAGRPITVTSAAEHGLPEPAETGATFAENARLKAHAAARATGLPALSDDSGLEVDALGGAPGVRTADWAETPQGRDFLLAMTRTRDAILAAGAPLPAPARFRATLCLAWPDGADELFEGAAEGHFDWPPRGAQGFGFDPCFTPLGHTLRFGEMAPEEKAPLTHRAAAFAALAARLDG